MLQGTVKGLEATCLNLTCQVVPSFPCQRLNLGGVQVDVEKAAAAAAKAAQAKAEEDLRKARNSAVEAVRCKLDGGRFGG